MDSFYNIFKSDRRKGCAPFSSALRSNPRQIIMTHMRALTCIFAKFSIFMTQKTPIHPINTLVPAHAARKDHFANRSRSSPSLELNHAITPIFVSIQSRNPSDVEPLVLVIRRSQN